MASKNSLANFPPFGIDVIVNIYYDFFLCWKVKYRPILHGWYILFIKSSLVYSEFEDQAIFSASKSFVYGLLTFKISCLERQHSVLCELIDRQIDGFLLIGWLLWLKNLVMQMSNLFFSAELIIKEEEQTWIFSRSITQCFLSLGETLPVLLKTYASQPVAARCSGWPVPSSGNRGVSVPLLTSKKEAWYHGKSSSGLH